MNDFIRAQFDCCFSLTRWFSDACQVHVTPHRESFGENVGQGL